LLGETDENHKPQDARSVSRDLNPRPPEYEAGVASTASRPSAHIPNLYPSSEDIICTCSFGLKLWWWSWQHDCSKQRPATTGVTEKLRISADKCAWTRSYRNNQWVIL